APAEYQVVSRLEQVRSRLSVAAQPAASRPVSQYLQIHRAPEPCDFFQQSVRSPLHQSIDLKLYFLHSQLRGWNEFFGPSPCQPNSSRHAHLSRSPHSSHCVALPLRFDSRVAPEGWAHSREVALRMRAFFRGRACPLMVTAVLPAAVPTRLQPVRVNSLL